MTQVLAGSTPVVHPCLCSSVELERLPPKEEVAGSNPARGSSYGSVAQLESERPPPKR